MFLLGLVVGCGGNANDTPASDGPDGDVTTEVGSADGGNDVLELDVLPDADVSVGEQDADASLTLDDVGDDARAVDVSESDGSVDVFDASDSTSNDTSPPEDTGLPDVVDAFDASEDGSEDASDTMSDLPALDDVLAALRDDASGAMLQWSRSSGWPVLTDEGYLIVNLDEAYPSIYGDFNDWTRTPMTWEVDFGWFLANADARGGYKFASDTTDSADPWSRAYVYDEFGRLSLVFGEGNHLEEHRQVGSDTILSRSVRVWVPDEPATRVLYAHDGQNLFDPSSFFGGWQLQETAPDGVLIVGIDNTVERFAEYTPMTDFVLGETRGGGADDFLAFVESEVFTLVETEYGSFEVVGMMGSSLGGILSLYAGARRPETYDMVIALSPASSYGSRGVNGDTIHDFFEPIAPGSFSVYLDSGGGSEGCVDLDGDGLQDDAADDADDYCATAQLRDQLAAQGFTYEVGLWHWWEPGAPHNEAAWAARVARPMEIFGEL